MPGYEQGDLQSPTYGDAPAAKAERVENITPENELKTGDTRCQAGGRVE